MHRTGSTWFQKSILDGRDGRPVNAIDDRAESTARIVLPRDLDYEPETTRAWVLDRLAESENRGHAPVISNERFSGNPASGWHDAERTATRLAGLMPDARVMLVVREQTSLLESMWLQQIRIGGISGIEDFLRPAERGDHRLPVPDARFLEFHRFVAFLDDLFGSDDVLVLPFELLRADPSAYLERIESFSGIAFPPPADNRPVYAAPSFLEVAVLRRVNLLTTRSSLHRAPPLPHLEPAGRRFARMIGRTATASGEARRRGRARKAITRSLEAIDFRTSNRLLAERMGIDLEGLGWRA
ncbi:MAG: hypothetical protein CMJ34_07615 [Phycisphaerae bacterium]|nr:hypothetical protein [Phycisphaerae bacterium]